MTPRARNLVLLFGALVGLAALLFFLEAKPEPGGGAADQVPAVSADGLAAEGVPSAASQPPVAAPFDRSRAREQFVGSSSCAACHQAQAAAYAKSHHAKALVPSKPDDVKAQLAQASFSSTHGGVTRFSAKDGAFQVTTPGSNGRAQTLPIVYTSGVWPLQQYVVATERGKLQSLGVVWDSRGKDDGGQRWFHVYGQGGIAHDDALFFTGSAQNWNHVCADCHSTLVERRYDPARDAFDTRWAELSVGCEACHGPGAEHVKRAQAAGAGAWPGDAKGLAVQLRPAAVWSPSASGSPTPRTPDTVEIEVCAPCHSRRQPLHEGFIAGDPLLDAFEPELLHAGRYHADGQVEGEVYEWASFLQSRMYASGVRCSDCHEPHSGELYAEGNALCVRCHAPARFDQESHTHHAGASAPRCVDCHMPSATFMQIDVRRDHSIRIPRPDLSVKLGTPNACNACHTKQSASWALEQVNRWNPQPRPAHFGEALASDRKGELGAPSALMALAQESSAPAIARATALERLGQYASPRAQLALQRALSSEEPLVVYGAVLGASELPPAQRAPLLLPLAGHRLRAVRVAVGKALAGVPLASLPAAARAALERAFSDVEQSFAVSASRPESQIEASSFELARGNLEKAEAALRAALRLAPCFAEAHLNLADLERTRQNEPAAVGELRAALTCDPLNASAHHALGLWLVRQKDTARALVSLKKAVELAPTETRFGYVLAVALANAGDFEAAVKTLQQGLAIRPNDTALLEALVAYQSRLGNVQAAVSAKQQLDALRQ